MGTGENSLPVLSVTAYTAVPWESAMASLRLLGPARQLGWEIIFGNHGPQVDPEKVGLADVVFIQRDFPRFVEACAQVFYIARQQKKPVIYDIDDLLFALPEEHIARRDLSVVLFPMISALQEADAVTTSTPVLQNHLKTLNENVWFLPNYLDQTLWQPGPAQRSITEKDELIVGYMGGQTHYEDLVTVTPVIQELLAKYPDHLKCRFWGGRPPDELLSHPSVEWINLDILDYQEFARYFVTQKCDIFISPLNNNTFNQAKSPIKFLEYSALGVPGVYTRIAPYESIVDHGKNGFLASSGVEWISCLSQLIDDPGLRYDMGAAAHETVMRHWLLSDHAVEWERAYRRALDATHPAEVETLERTALIFDAARQAESAYRSLEKENVLLQADLQWKLGEIAHLRAELSGKLNEIELLSGELQDIKSSRSWQMIQKLQRIRLKLIPQGSRLEKRLLKRSE